MINNALTANAITITLDQYVYQYGGMSTDADVLAALANHPNVTLAQG
jgi:phosphodiesterase/alkaline phosphatase D-like protein